MPYHEAYSIAEERAMRDVLQTLVEVGWHPGRAGAMVRRATERVVSARGDAGVGRVKFYDLPSKTDVPHTPVSGGQ